MGSGGKYLVDRLKEDGLHTAKVQDIVRVWIGEIHFAPEGSALYHPRANDPVNDALVVSLMDGFRAEEPIIVRDAGMVKGARRLEIIDGAQRKINGTVAEERLNAAGKLARTEGRYMSRLPTPRTFARMRAAVDGQRVPAGDLLDALAGKWGALEASAPKIAEALRSAQKEASKPGKRKAA